MSEAQSQTPPAESWRTWGMLLGLAALVTITNAFKPLHIDDGYYYFRAAHIAEHPLDPLGNEILYHQWPQSAFDYYVPPVVPYWFASAVALFGERPFLWKLWFLPFSLALVVGVFHLLKRFARPVALPMTAVIALCPAYLPSWNLMLDMPLLALSTASLALFLVACERDSTRWALWAGVVAGLAAQTKYNGLLSVPVIVTYALLQRKWRLGLLASIAAGGVFLAWECFTLAKYGRSHFHWSLLHPDNVSGTWPRMRMVRALCLTLGATLAPIALFEVLTWKGGRWLAAAGVALVVFGFSWLTDHLDESPVYAAFAVALGLTTTTALVRLWRTPSAAAPTSAGWRRTGTFLALWLGLEIASYLVLQPFGAVRRVLGVALVVMVIAASGAAAAWQPAWRPWLRGLVAFSALIGGGFATLDAREAWVSRDSARRADQTIRESQSEPTIWYLGHWGFTYYAQQLGMKPIIPDHSQLKRGDWLIFPDRVHKPMVQLLAKTVPIRNITTNVHDDGVPLETLPYFYSGASPIKHRVNPRMQVTIFRVTEDFVPETSWKAKKMSEWLQIRRDMDVTLYAIPALKRFLEDPDPKIRRRIARAVGEMGARGEDLRDSLRPLLEDSSPEVRSAAASSLDRIGKALGAADFPQTD